MMKPQLTEFIVVRPKSPTSRALIYRAEQYEVFNLTDYNLVAIINNVNTVSIQPIEDDLDLTQYVFCGTRFGRDEYCHKDDFFQNMEIYIKNSIHHLTNKLNLL